MLRILLLHALRLLRDESLLGPGRLILRPARRLRRKGAARLEDSRARRGDLRDLRLLALLPLAQRRQLRLRRSELAAAQGLARLPADIARALRVRRMARHAALRVAARLDIDAGNTAISRRIGAGCQGDLDAAEHCGDALLRHARRLVRRRLKIVAERLAHEHRLARAQDRAVVLRRELRVRRVIREDERLQQPRLRERRLQALARLRRDLLFELHRLVKGLAGDARRPQARARRAHSLVLLRLRLARFLELRDLHFLRLTRLSRLDEREAHL